jgi:hypothetical protein
VQYLSKDVGRDSVHNDLTMFSPEEVLVKDIRGGDLFEVVRLK